MNDSNSFTLRDRSGEDISTNRNTDDTQKFLMNERVNNKRSRWYVMTTVLLGLICVLLMVGIIVQQCKLFTERDLIKMNYRSMAEEYNETLSSLKTKYSQLTNEREELQNRFNSVNEKKLELEANYSQLTNEREELQNGFNSVNQKKLELEANYSQLTNEREELQNRFNSVNQIKLELETKVKNLNDKLLKYTAESGTVWYYVSRGKKTWSESRQFCRNRGGDLVIINTEDKQNYISEIAKERVWIGLSDIQNESKMKWVDNTPLNKGFWDKNEPNDEHGQEDCVELNPTKPALNNWNDLPCSITKRWICEK